MNRAPGARVIPENANISSLRALCFWKLFGCNLAVIVDNRNNVHLPGEHYRSRGVRTCDLEATAWETSPFIFSFGVTS